MRFRFVRVISLNSGVSEGCSAMTIAASTINEEAAHILLRNRADHQYRLCPKRTLTMVFDT